MASDFEDQLRSKLISNPVICAATIDFVAKLNSQGILEEFIIPEKYLILVAELYSKEMLTPKLKEFFSEFDPSSPISYMSHFIMDAVENLLAAGITESTDIELNFKQYLNYLEDPINAAYLFGSLAELSKTICTFYADAITLYCSSNHITDDSEYFGLLSDAFPLGIKRPVEAQEWIKRKSVLFKKINFDPVSKHLAIDTYFDYIYGNISATPGGLTPSTFKARATDLFRVMILEDVFKKIDCNKKRLSSAQINKAIHSLFYEKPLYVYSRYISAMYVLFYEDDIHARSVAQSLNMDYESYVAIITKPMPAFSYNGFYGINIPS